MNIMEMVRQEVRQALFEMAAPQIGNVKSVDGKTLSVKVELQSTGVETNWLRILSPVSGINAGFGVRLPKENDEVMVIFTDFDHTHGYVIGAVFNDEELPPNGVIPVDPEAEMDPDTFVIAQWENGGMLVVEKSRDAAAPIIRITNNQEDEISVEGGVITIKTAKDVVVEGDNASITTNTDATIAVGGDAMIDSTGKVTVKSGGNTKLQAGGNVDIVTTGTCTLNGGTQPVNNLPACLFSGAPHGTNPLNLA